MAVGTPVSKDSGDDTAASTTYNSASITPSANTIVIAVGHCSRASNPPELATVTSSGMTWTPIGNINFNNVATPLNKLAAWWGVGASPGTGTVLFTFSTNANGFSWSIFEVPGCDLVAPIVASSFQSANGNAGTTASVALNTIASSDNGYIVATGLDASVAITQRASWSEIHDFAGTSPAKQTETQYRLGVDDDASSTFTSADWGILGFELAAAAAADTVEVFVGRRMISIP